MSKLFRARQGTVLTSLAAIAAIAVLIVLGLTAGRSGVGRAIPVTARTGPTTAEVRLALTAIGMDAQSLAAAGLSANQATAAVDAAKAALADSIVDLRAADADLSSLSAERDRLEFLVRTGRGGENDPAALATAQASFNTALAERQTLLAVVFTAATAGLDEGPVAILSAVQANRGHHLPIRYLAASRTGDQWNQLSDAYDNHRSTARTGRTPNAGLAEILAGADSDSAAINSSLQANLAGVSAAWDSATVGG